MISGFVDPDQRPPLVIYGLQGIGRRTLVRAIAEDNLSYSSIIPFALKAGALLPETFIRLSEHPIAGEVKNCADSFAEQEAKPPQVLVADVVR